MFDLLRDGECALINFEGRVIDIQEFDLNGCVYQTKVPVPDPINVSAPFVESDDPSQILTSKLDDLLNNKIHKFLGSNFDLVV